MLNIFDALKAYREGQLEETESLCRQILASSPKQPQASLLLAQVLLKRGRVREAEELTSLALIRNPGHTDLLAQHGEILAILGRKEEALSCFSKAIDQRLINPRAHDYVSALLAECKDPSPRFTVSIITPTVGRPYLVRAIESVQTQTYPFLEHLIVADGPEYHDRVRSLLPQDPRHPIHLLPLPFNVGAGGYCGHRVYGAAPYLVNGRFVAFLDEDNWFEPEHITLLMAKISVEGLSWAYALRKIVNPKGRFITNDDCESLGQWPTWNNSSIHLVDANCYMLRRDLAIEVGHLWYRRFRDEENPDFAICRQLLRNHPRCGTPGRYTVNYRLGSSPASVQADFFLKGNSIIRQRFIGTLPWRDPNVST